MSNKSTKVKTHLLSIDIGSHSVKVATGQRNGDRIKITALAKQELPKGVFTNGVLSDPLALKTTIQAILKQNNIKQKDTVLTYESQDIIKREMIVPKVDPKDQFELITFEVGQYLPIDIEAYVLQYKVLEEFDEDNKPKLKILLGAIPKDIVKALYELVEDCGLNPLYMDMHSNSLEKFIEFGFDSLTMNKTIAMIDFGHQLIDISLFEKGVFKFNRLLRLGAGEFDRILVHNLDIDPAEAESRKKKTSILAIQKAKLEDITDESDVKSTVIKETLSYINECADEIEKVFKYYTSRNTDNKIDQIYLFGGGAQFKEIAPFFNERFDINTEVISNFNMIDIATKNPVEEIPVYVHAAGALVRK